MKYRYFLHLALRFDLAGGRHLLTRWLAFDSPLRLMAGDDIQLPDTDEFADISWTLEVKQVRWDASSLRSQPLAYIFCQDARLSIDGDVTYARADFELHKIAGLLSAGIYSVQEDCPSPKEWSLDSTASDRIITRFFDSDEPTQQP